MPEPITISLTPAQADDFATLVREEENARLTLDRIPVARNYAARAILLGQYPLSAFDGQNIHVDVSRGTISFTPNAALGESEPVS